MPINNIDSKCLKDNRTCLIGYLDFISRENGFNSLGGGHTNTHKHAYQLPRQKQLQKTRCMLAFGQRKPGLKL